MGPIRITMIIGLALIESLVIYALVIAFLLLQCTDHLFQGPAKDTPEGGSFIVW